MIQAPVFQYNSKLLDSYPICSKEENFEEQCCDSPQIIQEQGFFVCAQCGTVFDQTIDFSPKRAYSMEELMHRKESEPKNSLIGPRTILKGVTDANGVMLNPKDISKYNRLGKIHRSFTSGFERNLWVALPIFHRLTERMGITSRVKEDALRIYSLAVKERLTMGRSIDVLLAATVFLSNKINGIPTTIEEVLPLVDVDKKAVIRCYRQLMIKILPKIKVQFTSSTPKMYVDKFGEHLQLNMQTRKFAIDLIEKAKSKGLFMEGKDPKGFAAGAIYIASHKNKMKMTQTEIANCCHITEVTLRMRYRELCKYC
jgi:transcription initiation factor TFIIB